MIVKGGSQSDKKIMFFDGGGKTISENEKAQRIRESAADIESKKNALLKQVEDEERKLSKRHSYESPHLKPRFKLVPTGFTVLIELLPMKAEEIKPVSSVPGLYIPIAEKELQKEECGRDLGRVISWGPLAFIGYGNPDQLTRSAKDWGIEQFDIVEFRRYDGKATRLADTHEEYSLYRWINDKDIIGVIKNYEENK